MLPANGLNPFSVDNNHSWIASGAFGKWAFPNSYVNIDTHYACGTSGVLAAELSIELATGDTNVRIETVRKNAGVTANVWSSPPLSGGSQFYGDATTVLSIGPPLTVRDGLGVITSVQAACGETYWVGANYEGYVTDGYDEWQVNYTSDNYPFGNTITAGPGGSGTVPRTHIDQIFDQWYSRLAFTSGWQCWEDDGMGGFIDHGIQTTASAISNGFLQTLT